MIGVGLAFMLEYLDNTIHTENDLEQKVGLPVLGTISHIEDSDVRSDPLTFQQNQAKRRSEERRVGKACSAGAGPGSECCIETARDSRARRVVKRRQGRIR